MDLLDYNVRQELFKKSPVFTKTRDDVPAVYREGNNVKNSLVADGCVIEGNVENCVLFRGVHIGRNASVKNAIIMQDSEIEDSVGTGECHPRQECHCSRHGRLIGQVQYPIVIARTSLCKGGFPI